MAKTRSPTTRRLSKVAKGFKAKEMEIATKDIRIVNLEEELARLKRGKKRKAIPNPNRRFIQIGEALAAREPIPPIQQEAPAQQAEVVDEVVVVRVVDESEAEEVDMPPDIITRSGRMVKRRRLS